MKSLDRKHISACLRLEERENDEWLPRCTFVYSVMRMWNQTVSMFAEFCDCAETYPYHYILKRWQLLQVNIRQQSTVIQFETKENCLPSYALIVTVQKIVPNKEILKARC